MSRKLIYVSGLLACFVWHLEFDNKERATFFDGPDASKRAIEFFRAMLQRPPLEILCGALLRHPHLNDTADRLLGAYNGFLGTLADADKRSHLEHLLPEQQDDDSVYKDVRELSHRFRDGLLAMFFDRQSGLYELTRLYGVF
ncbi:MAG TPA: hypothetical protein VIX89_18235 [Bryobacteraceae bacterium]